MNNEFDRADDVTIPASTYTTVVRPHQLKRGDLFTEPVTMNGRYTRTVLVDSVVYGELTYRGAPVSVLFVTGRDTHNRAKVVHTRTPWEFLTVTRTGPQPPAYLRPLTTTAETFVY